MAQGRVLAPWMELDCTRCRGLPPEDCELCDGSGTLRLNRCPMAVVPPDVWIAIDAVAFLVDVHLPPVPGGLFDQSALFVQAYRVVNHVRNECIQAQFGH